MKNLRILLNMKNFLLLISSLVLFFIFSFCRLHDRSNKKISSEGIDQFFATGIPYHPSIDDYMLKDYFSKENFKNGAFQKNRLHWISTAVEIKTGQQIKKNRLFLTDETYLSPPYSLKIEAHSLPCRLFYSMIPTKNPARDPWDYKNESIWLGIEPSKRIKISFYYKGAGPTAYINLLKQNGDLSILTTKMENQPALNWKKMELQGIIPLGGRGISLEITINANQPKRIMFLDDVSVEVI